jgi:CubicO group peptidase (beta-lactamase class C family)
MLSLTDRVDAIFSKWDTVDSPGCSLGVVKDGELIYKRGYGMADLERGVPITSNSIFDIGSTGKQFTATVIAILANRGLLGLDDSLRKHLPEMPRYADSITLHNLVHHTSGLRDYLTLMTLCGMSDVNYYPEYLLLDLITRQKRLNFKPGSAYLYSNSGYFLLGVIAQRVTGQHVTELIRELILNPLGMKNTTFNKDHRPIVRHRALSYDPGKVDGTFINALALSGGFGDGAVLTNLEDLLLWDRNFYDNKLNDAQPDLIEGLHKTGRLNNGNSITYGFGLDVSTYRDQKVVKHAGGWAGYRSEMMRFPEQCLTVICLSNLGSMDPTLLCQQVAEIYLEDVLGQRKTGKKRALKPPATLSAEAFSGIYQSKYATVEIFAKDGELHYSNGNVEHALHLFGNQKFQLADYPVFLTFSGNGNERLSIAEIGEPVTRFKRVQLERSSPSDLSVYAGEYISAELNIRYTVDFMNDALKIKRTPFDKPRTLRSLTENTFSCRFGELRWHSGHGPARGFVLHAGRVTNIKFRKATKRTPVQGESSA